MIIGHGVDLIDIRRIDRTIDRFGERFIKRIFTKNDRRGMSPLKYPELDGRAEAKAQGPACWCICGGLRARHRGRYFIITAGDVAAAPPS